MSLRELPHDAALLYLEIDYGTSNTRERVSGTRDRPLHLKEGHARAIDDIHDTLIIWEDHVREARSLSARRVLRYGAQISSSSQFLTVHLRWILGQNPTAVTEFGYSITKVHEKAKKMTHHVDPVPQRCVGVRCPACAWKSLAWELDGGFARTGNVVCQNCSKLLTESEYYAEVGRQAKVAA